MVDTQKINVIVKVFGIAYEFNINKDSQKKFEIYAKYLNELLQKTSDKVDGKAVTQGRLMVMAFLDLIGKVFEDEKEIENINKMLEKACNIGDN